MPDEKRSLLDIYAPYIMRRGRSALLGDAPGVGKSAYMQRVVARIHRMFPQKKKGSTLTLPTGRLSFPNALGKTVPPDPAVAPSRLAASPVCPHCGGKKFLWGPCGGFSQNILCANPECRHWFNWDGFRLDDLHRVEPTKAEKEATRRQQEEIANGYRDSVTREGMEFYRSGLPPLACLKDTEYRSGNICTPKGEDFIRLIGYVDAMRADMREMIRGR